MEETDLPDIAEDIPKLPDGKLYHMFISHSQHEDDVRWSLKFRSRLLKYGYRVCIPHDEYNPDFSVKENTKKAIQSSLKTVLVLSPHFFKSRGCQLEMSIAEVLQNELKKQPDDGSPEVEILVPVMIQTVEIPVSFHVIDARADKKWFNRLFTAIKRLSNETSVSDVPDVKEYDAFFIYRTVSPDKEWVESVVGSLETSTPKITCAYHKRDFRPGRTIFQNVIDFVRRSKKVIIVLSPEFLVSEWTKYETEIAQVRNIQNPSDVCLIPVVLRDCEMPRYLSTLTYLDATDNINSWWPRLLKAINIPNDDLSLLPPGKHDKIQMMKIITFQGQQEDDPSVSWLINIEFIDGDSILVTDARNKKLKRFSFKGDLECELEFKTRPMFFALFDDNIAYVTFPDETVVRSVNITASMMADDEFAVPHQCSGICTINKKNLAICSRSECSILIMTRSGETLFTIKPLVGISDLTDEEYSKQTNIGSEDPHDSEEEADNIGKPEAVGKKDFKSLKSHRSKVHLSNNRLVWPDFISAFETGHIFVTDYETHLLTAIYLDNTQKDHHHKSVPLVNPRGMTIHEGRLFLAAGTIRIFSFDLVNEGELIFDGGPITSPRSITVNKTGSYIAVSHKGDGDERISIYQLLPTK